MLLLPARVLPVSACDGCTVSLGPELRMVVRNGDSWPAAWGLTGATIPAPAVDLSREIVLLAATRSYGGTGHAIALDSIYGDTATGRVFAVVRERSNLVHSDTAMRAMAAVAVPAKVGTTYWHQVVFLERAKVQVDGP